MTTVLVTGGHGFIGRYVVANLLGRGIHPLILDRRRDAIPLPGTQLFLGDVRDPVAVTEAVSLSDGVIHLAGVLGTQETLRDPRPAIETNVYGSLQVFQACVAAGVRCTYITVGNHWMYNSYSTTKTCAERLAWQMNREQGGQIAVVRALNAYGPGQKWAPVRKILPSFLRQALLGQPIEVYGDGSQVMDMIHVRDLADVLVRALVVDHGQYCWYPIEGADNPERFSAGTGRITTVQEIAELVIETVGRGTIEHLPMRPGEPPGACVLGNPATLRTLYAGALPELVSLELGLWETAEAMRQLHGRGVLEEEGEGV